jgi:maltose alpha-D-glucosyltransferase/alpha-amylase
MLPTVALTGGWKTVLEPPARRELEQAVLPLFLRRQRWFGGKGRRLESVRLADWGDFPAGERCVFLALLEMQFGAGQPELYFCPIGVTGGAAADRMMSDRRDWVMTQLAGPEGMALLHDALADDDTCTALLECIGSGSEFLTHSGQVCGIPTAAYDPLRGAGAESLPVERGPATSSNTLLFYGRRLLLKVFRRLEAGMNPDFEIGRFLTEKTSFDRIPRVAGCIEYHRSGSPPITLAILQERVENQSDGWRHVLEELDRYYRQASPCLPVPDVRPLLELAESDPPSPVREAIGDYLHSAATLGRRTAELHRALAADTQNPDFAPEPFTSKDAAALRDSVHVQAERALAALHDNIERLPVEIASSARRLLEEGPAALKRLEQEWPFEGGAAKIRCHGDYHLGQVLRVEDDYVILDFEGEPARSVQERRARQSPLKDVAGMLRSYHYAAYAGLFAFAHHDSRAFSRLEPCAEAWFRWVSAAFLRAYRAAAQDAAFLPGDAAQFEAQLDAFMLDKAFYELNYELNNRPDWVRIPLRGILALLGFAPVAAASD